MRMLTETDPPMAYCVVDTPLGAVGLAWSELGVTRLQLPHATREATERHLRGRARRIARAKPAGRIGQVAAMIERYMAGQRVDFSAVPLDLAGVGSFHRTVYEAARTVGWGETTTYGALARRAGAADAARAVGQAMGRNPVPIIVPCHRVLASGGKVGGFSSFGGGDTKQRLLALEGVHLGGTPLLPGI